MKKDIIIGIDPDSRMSGVARLDVAERKAWADTLPFPLVIEYVREVVRKAEAVGKGVVVVIEKSWNVTTNWHTRLTDSKAVAAKKGYAVGRCHETGCKIEEMLEHYGIEVREQLPLRKIWKGKDGKITHEEMTEVCGWSKKRSNGEERDAMLLAWCASGLPIRVRVKK